MAATDAVGSLPVVVLMAVDGCNCRCVMCEHWRGRPRTVPLDQVRSWIGSWLRLGVRRVALSGGEPLLHPQLPELLDLLAGAGFALTTITNGLLLGDAAAAVGSACDSVVVSLDGPEPVHDTIRGVDGAYRQLAIGIEAVRRANPSAIITARCTVQHGNHRELRAVVRCARELGADTVSFLAVDSSSTAFQRRRRVGPPGLDGDGVQALGAEVERLIHDHRDDIDSGFIAESAAKLRQRIGQRFAARLGLAPEPVVRCNAPWVSAVVGVGGTVQPCFFHPAYQQVADDLDAVVNAPDAIAFRRRLDVSTDAVCRRCVCPLHLRPGEDPR
jgi:MoaA/NifB/PqqE/SkfB family radical SAM enzyme